MLTISKKDVTGNLGPDNRPAAFCKSGDTVLFETRDCYDDRKRNAAGSRKHFI